MISPLLRFHSFFFVGKRCIRYRKNSKLFPYHQLIRKVQLGVVQACNSKRSTALFASLRVEIHAFETSDCSLDTTYSKSGRA